MTNSLNILYNYCKAEWMLLTVVLSKVALDKVVFYLLLYLIFMSMFYYNSQALKKSDYGCYLGRRYVGYNVGGL